MEKGFNDDELADIMSEIESLEQEFADDDNAQSEEVEAAQDQTENVESEEQEEEEEFVAKQEEEEEVEVEEQYTKPQKQQPAAKVDSKMNDVLDELSEMPVEDVVPQQKIQKYDDNIHHMKQPVASHHGNAASTSMSFRVEGEMKLDLSFCVGGQTVALQVSDKGFEIELAGGAKFTLPLGVHHQGHKAA